MKRKHVAAGLLLMALASCALAYELAQSSERQMQAWRPSEDAQLQSLDRRLAEKVEEFLELSALLGDQLEQARLAEGRQQNAPLLVAPRAQAEQVEPAPRRPEARIVRRAPWWSKYRLSMIVSSSDARSAVINGRYVRPGDSLAPGVVVRRIGSDEVVLARAGQTARLTMGRGR